MRQCRLCVVAFISIVMMLMGCEKKESSVLPQRTEIDYSILKKGETPSQVNEYMSARQGEEYTESISVDGYVYAVISYGSKDTSGYSIQIDEVSEGDKDISIVAKLIEPGKDARVNQVITNPYVVIKLCDKGKKVNINSGGKVSGTSQK